MKTKLIGTAVIAVLVAVGCGKKEAARDDEQATKPNHIEEILKLAKKSAEQDGNVNFCGFFTGMSSHDATDLAAYYKLDEDEYSFLAESGKAVSALWFSPKGVRRITGGGNTIEKLAQAVQKQVGDLKESYGIWKRSTVDGVVVTFSSEGLTIQNDSLASRPPVVTQGNAEIEAIIDIVENMVAIPGKDFKMGKYEVTQAQWEAVMGKNLSRFKGADNPVEHVSWDDCQEFLKKLNALPKVKDSGWIYRLPTEKEWEYACRAESRGNYCTPEDRMEITERTLGKVAWYDDNSGRTTHPVGRKMPNAFGLYDMHGNVCEWCEDLVQADNSKRVFRGGSWNRDSGKCRASSRSGNLPVSRVDYIGFRLAASDKKRLSRQEPAVRPAADIPDRKAQPEKK